MSWGQFDPRLRSNIFTNPLYFFLKSSWSHSFLLGNQKDEKKIGHMTTEKAQAYWTSPFCCCTGRVHSGCVWPWCIISRQNGGNVKTASQGHRPHATSKASSSRPKACLWFCMHFYRPKVVVVLTVCFEDDVMVAILPFFSPKHSHGRNFALIFFKIADQIEIVNHCLLLKIS